MKDLSRNDPFYERDIRINYFENYLHFYEIENYDLRYYLFLCAESNKDHQSHFFVENKFAAPEGYPSSSLREEEPSKMNNNWGTKVKSKFIKTIKLEKTEFDHSQQSNGEDAYEIHRKNITDQWRVIVKNYIKEFLDENVKTITIQEKKTIYCDKCEISITYSHWKEHTRTKKHLNYIEHRLKKENKEKKINCVCGSVLVASSINKHKKSDKHKNFISQNK